MKKLFMNPLVYFLVDLCQILNEKKIQFWAPVIFLLSSEILCRIIWTTAVAIDWIPSRILTSATVPASKTVVP